MLYRDFRDTGEFTKLVREHLDGLIIDEWRGDKWTEVPGGDSVESSLLATLPAAPVRGESLEIDGAEREDDELGILEYMAAFHEAAEAIVDVMTAITEETQRVGEESRARSIETDLVREELDKQKGIGGSRAQQQFVREARTTVDRAAENLEQFVTGMTRNVEQYKAHNRAMFDNMRHAFQASAELGPRDDAEGRQALSKLIPVIHESREHVMNFQASISRVPALTGRFKRARRRAAAILGELVAEMSFSMQEAASLLEEMGGDLPDSAA